MSYVISKNRPHPSHSPSLLSEFVNNSIFSNNLNLPFNLTGNFIHNPPRLNQNPLKFDSVSNSIDVGFPETLTGRVAETSISEPGVPTFDSELSHQIFPVVWNINPAGDFNYKSVPICSAETLFPEIGVVVDGNPSSVDVSGVPAVILEHRPLSTEAPSAKVTVCRLLIGGLLTQITESSVDRRRYLAKNLNRPPRSPLVAEEKKEFDADAATIILKGISRVSDSSKRRKSDECNSLLPLLMGMDEFELNKLLLSEPPPADPNG